MFNIFKVSFLISMFLFEYAALTSLEARSKHSMVECEGKDSKSRGTLRHKRPPASVKKKLSPEELAQIIKKQAQGKTTNVSGTYVGKLLENIKNNKSPSIDDLKEMRAFNLALRKAEKEYMREINYRKLPRRRAITPNTFKKPTDGTSLNRRSALGIKRSERRVGKKTGPRQAPINSYKAKTIKKTRQTRNNGTVSKLGQHKAHWKNHRAEINRLGYKKFIEKSYSRQ